ncbi:MAG: DUF3450 domain-containing protein [Campylobacterota bacterium]|nr:DUF3450 domain-containing protein [Campylobacterota bacterium]
MKIFLVSIVLVFTLHAQVDGMLGAVENTHAKSASSQKKIDSYADQSETLFDQYTKVERELEEQRLYNRQLEMIIETQKGEIPKLKQQLEKIEVTQKKIIPLMFEMVETLDKLVAIDTPFLQEERTQRVSNLKSFMANPDISLGEQFRMITQSYKIEYGYARTLEVYRSKLEDKTVDFIRVGRLGLYYQTLDLQECGIYDAKNKTWVKLESTYNEHIRKAIRMARKKIAPDFLTFPVIKDVS